MRLSIGFVAGLVLTIGASEVCGADHPPPLDRPTPPPCCADGVCYPNPITWGVYPTRWRRWPGVTDPAPEPSPAPAPGELGPEVPPFETPPPEEEERRAPPPTQQRRALPEAPEADEPTPGAPTPAPTDAAPPTPPFDAGPSPGPSLEEGPLEPGTVPRMPWDEPTSDVDPPPVPPFAAVRLMPFAPAVQRSVRTPRVPATAQGPSSTNDPPPPLPLALNESGF